MSQKEAPRVGLLKALLAGRVTGPEVAAALQLSDRQVRRLRRRFEAEGAGGLLHRGRGRPAPRRLAPALRQRVAQLLMTKYRDFNDCHATEQLREVEGLAISRATVRRLRRALGRPAKHRRRPRRYRARREPRARMGALVQVDASPFDWLEGRGPTLSLHGAIDDATGTVLALHFRPTEDLHGYTTVLAAVATQYGLPLALYGDRLNVFLRNDAHWTLAEELRGTQDPTHFGQMLQALGIAFIPAGSPQAKGSDSGRRCKIAWSASSACARSPRARRPMPSCPPSSPITTGASRAPPRAPRPAWRPAPRELGLLLGGRYRRRVAADNTVRLGLRWVQLPPGPGRRSWAGQTVEVRELVDGRVVVLHEDHVLATAPSPGPDFMLRPRRALRDAGPGCPARDARQSRASLAPGLFPPQPCPRARVAGADIFTEQLTRTFSLDSDNRGPGEEDGSGPTRREACGARRSSAARALKPDFKVSGPDGARRTKAPGSALRAGTSGPEGFPGGTAPDPGF